jgi:hypothetical protein
MVSYPAQRIDGTVREERPSTRFGFRYGERGTHGSRNMMLPGLRQLLASTPVSAVYEDYRAAIMEENDVHLANADKRAAPEPAAGARPC